MTKLGCCFGYYEQDQSYLNLIKDNFNFIIPEAGFKWDYITKNSLAIDWSLPDSIVEFAQKNRKDIIGSVLFFCPYSSVPQWFLDYTPKVQYDFIKSYISQIISKYPIVNIWEIIGEFVDDNGLPRDSHPIVKEYGLIKVVSELLHLSKEINNNNIILLSDYRVQSDKKWQTIWEVVDALLCQKVPIDGVSIQLHHHIKTLPYVPFYLEKRCKEAQQRGLEVNLSEISLFAHKSIPDKIAYQFQNAYFKKLALIAKKHDAISMTIWGVTDKYGWRYDNFSDRPYLFDSNYNPKQAFFTVKQILADN